MRDAGSGVREGGGLMAAEYLWGMCIDEFEKPVQVESFKPSQVWEGGAEGDGWVVLQLPGINEANDKKYKRKVRYMAHMRLIDKTYLGQLSLSEKAWPPSIRGLREAVGARTRRNASRLYRR